MGILIAEISVIGEKVVQTAVSVTWSIEEIPDKSIVVILFCFSQSPS